MLRGGEKQFSRQVSKKAAIKVMNLTKQISDSAVQVGGLSSRRRGVPSPGSQSPGSPMQMIQEFEPDT